MLSGTIESNLAEYNRALSVYLDYHPEARRDALEHKVANLGLALARGFREHQFGGIPRRRGLAMGQLASRTANGQGTKVRGSLLDEYRTRRTGLLKKRRGLRAHLMAGGTIAQMIAADRGLNANRQAGISLWQQVVGREVKTRQSGIGYLAAAFQWYRTRGKGEDKRLVQNRSKSPIGYVQVQGESAVIVGELAGISEIDERYQIVNKALKDETDDTMEYIVGKLEAKASQLLNQIK
jgi:hypothetical protein